ncbi:RDD family protein [Pedobacter chitinilyticus]|uniref:RDD family protein n=1 Tax=Pedobacter chitinilyticus TaxID=2233776 RepID=A0A3S3PM18_9SPHI|nr:RDD family protein [Pedobacter chitinilyticus]RWU03920.1 RDD family protein [Pedobacter chitinilyticus]
MNADFKDVMSKRTDQELIKIITLDREDYQPLAIEAAEAEIKNRGIDQSLIEESHSKINASAKAWQPSVKVNAATRFAHFVIDTIIWLVLTTILTLPINAQDNTQMLLGYLIMLATFIGYYTLLETKYQKTVAKFITKTNVVNQDGFKPTTADILRRTLCRIIPFDAISFLFSTNGFHDRLSNTKVIRDENL